MTAAAMKINIGTVAGADEKPEKGGRILADVARRRSPIEMEGPGGRPTRFRWEKWLSSLLLAFSVAEWPPRRFYPFPISPRRR